MLLRTKLVGVSFGNRQYVISKLPSERDLLASTYELGWRREPENQFDSNSVLVLASKDQDVEIGHLNREIAAKVSPLVDAGVKMTIYLTAITGKDKVARGVNVLIEVDDGKAENVSPQN